MAGRNDGPEIRDVWATNLEIEMENIRVVIDQFPYVAMVRACNHPSLSHIIVSIQDTEFPGVVARPIGTFKTSSDYHYQTMRCNVDLLRIIQVGITLANEDGEQPIECGTWQFNFKFNIELVIAKIVR
jgi:CCR4-NOT transcription complex subunit 7/8